MCDTGDKYSCFYLGKKLTINKELADKRGIDDATLLKIQELHFLREATKDLMGKVENLELLPGLAEVLTDVEYQLQDLWGFERNPNYHRWFEVPRCSCPKMDNSDSLGSSTRYHDGTCPVHSQGMNMTEEHKTSGIYIIDVDNIKGKMSEGVKVASEGVKVASEAVQEKWAKTKGLFGEGLVNLGKKLKKE